MSTSWMDSWEGLAYNLGRGFGGEGYTNVREALYQILDYEAQGIELNEHEAHILREYRRGIEDGRAWKEPN